MCNVNTRCDAINSYAVDKTMMITRRKYFWWLYNMKAIAVASHSEVWLMTEIYSGHVERKSWRWTFFPVIQTRLCERLANNPLSLHPNSWSLCLLRKTVAHTLISTTVAGFMVLRSQISRRLFVTRLVFCFD